MYPTPPDYRTFGPPPRGAGPLNQSIPVVRQIRPPHSHAAKVPTDSELDWQRDVDRLIKEDLFHVDEWLNDTKPAPPAAAPTPGSPAAAHAAASSPGSAVSQVVPRDQRAPSAAAQQMKLASQITEGHAVERLLRMQNEQMEALLWQRQETLTKEEVTQVAAETHDIKTRYNRLKDKGDEYAIQLKELHDDFNSLDAFNPEAPKLMVPQGPRVYRFGEDSDEESIPDAFANTTLRSATRGKHGENDAYSLAASIAGSGNLMRVGYSPDAPQASMVSGKLMHTAKKMNPASADRLSELMEEITKAEAAVEEAEFTEQVLIHMTKRTVEERKKAELLSIESKKESDEDMRHYELAKAKLMRTRSHTTARHGDVKRMRQKVAKRSAELQYELSELQRVRGLINVITAQNSGVEVEEHPLLAKLEQIAASRRDKASQLAHIRTEVAHVFVDETKAQQLDNKLERLQEGFSRAAKVLNVPTVISFTDDGSSLGPDYSEMSHVEEEMIRLVVQAAKEPDRMMSDRAKHYDQRKAELLAELEKQQHRLLEVMPYAGHTHTATHAAAVEADKAAKAAHDTTDADTDEEAAEQFRREDKLSNVEAASEERVAALHGELAAAREAAADAAKAAAAAVDDAINAREEARRASVAVLEKSQKRKRKAKGLYQFAIGMLRTMHLDVECAAASALNLVKTTDYDVADDRARRIKAEEDAAEERVRKAAGGRSNLLQPRKVQRQKTRKGSISPEQPRSGAASPTSVPGTPQVGPTSGSGEPSPAALRSEAPAATPSAPPRLRAVMRRLRCRPRTILTPHAQRCKGGRRPILVTYARRRRQP